MFKNSLVDSLAPRSNREKDTQLLSKISTSKVAVAKTKGNSIKDKMDLIWSNVERHLSFLLDKVESIRQKEQLEKYITKCIQNGEVALDTETTGLNPMEDTIIGFSLYTPGEKAVYIPVWHKSYVTGAYLDNQISTKDIAVQLQRLVDAETKLIMHNAKFDIRTIFWNFGIILKCYWDSMICAKLLNNEEKAGLKEQYANKILGGKKEYDYSSLFKGVEFAMIPVNTATPYAAGDTLETYELYQWQVKEITKYPGIEKLFRELEMPLLEAVIHMEDHGVALDIDFASELSDKYHKMLREVEEKIYIELDKYKDKIEMYRFKHPNKLSNPININSSTQLAIVIYDIIGIQAVDKKSPRGTGEEILEKIKLPLCSLILEERGIVKLLSTYIDKLPLAVGKDKRIHASFNQVGTDTGRFSSQDPNLQNIPSHNKEIRKMFVASREVEVNCFETEYDLELLFADEVETTFGYVRAEDLKIGDTLIVSRNGIKENKDVREIFCPSEKKICINF